MAEEARHLLGRFLRQMDRFEGEESKVVIIGATNRREVLPPYSVPKLRPIVSQ